MKRKLLLIINLFVFVFTFISSIFVTPTKVNAFTPLDYIESYKIVVTPNDDATLNMEYSLKWKVLDSSSEGPLEWVKIGVPNRFVENIQVLSNDIEKAYYYSDDGAYIRLDLARKFYKDSVVDLHFSFVQKRIFTNKTGEIEYGFIPGWFPEIKVETIEVFWADTKAPIYDDAVSHSDGYYYWSDSLDCNETIKCNIKYDKEAFPTIDLSKGYSDEYETPLEKFLPLIVFFVFVAIFITVYIIAKINSDRYHQYRGFSGNDYFYHPWWYMHRHSHGVNTKGKEITPPVVKTSGHSGGHSGGGCACACACACAGGGRAGCARKDFYPPKAKIENIENSK